ncbi:hypothetical protein M426DRAFT_9747 [Hypoxylon sp. CI-4A]|nr:hypothetical protein M426DRAFT_9747 [Hypoxylon sp. CI-4A]
MAHAAPGFVPEHNDRPCYNCGVRGHLFTACPEEPRKVPAGLEASWARQQSSSSPHNDNLAPNRRGKGPVITRYPPPIPPVSHNMASLPRFEQPQPQPYGSGAIPGYPPQPTYSSTYGIPPPPNSSYDRYGPPPPPGPPQSFNPPPSYSGAYTASYGPPGPARGPYDYPQAPPPGRSDQYFQPSDYPPTSLNRPEQYPPRPPAPPSYGAAQPYLPGPPPSYLPPPSYGQPTPYSYQSQPPGYHQADYGPPQREPPIHFPEFPPPSSSYTRSYGDDRSRYPRDRDPQPHHDDRRLPERWYSPPPSSNSSYRDNYRDGRHDKPYRDDRHSRRRGSGRAGDDWRRDRHERSHPYKNSEKPDRQNRRRPQPATTPSQTASRERNSLDRGTPLTVKTDQEREPGEIVSDPSSASDHGAPEPGAGATVPESEEDPDWDERTIFLEIPLPDKVDAIAAPLPTQYSEDVMIPPAFDAKGLKSRYITPRNLDDFAQSIRETREWQVMQHHPAFLDPFEICLEMLVDYDKAIQRESSIRNSRRDRSSNFHDAGRNRHSNSKGFGRHPGRNQEPRFKQDHGKRRWDEFHGDMDSSKTENRYRDSSRDGAYTKRIKPLSPEPGEVVEDEEESPYEPPYEPSALPLPPRDGPKADPESVLVKDTKIQSPDHSNRDGSVSSEVINRQSNISPPVDQNRNHGLSPMPKTQPVDITTSHNRPPSSQSSRSPQRHYPNSRRSSIASEVSHASLDSIERELLGLGGHSSNNDDSEDEIPKEPLKKLKAKVKRRQPTVAAFSRRW